MDKEKTFKNKQKSKNLEKPKMLRRTLSRLIAVQILYQKSFNQIDESNIGQIKNDVVENYLIDFNDEIESYREKIDENFLDNLLSGLPMVIDTIDEIIEKNLKKNWQIKDLDEILLQILRLAIFELKYIKNIPVKVVIDEYVSISASFFDEKKVTFVNATLDKIAKENSKINE